MEELGKSSVRRERHVSDIVADLNKRLGRPGVVDSLPQFEFRIDQVLGLGTSRRGSFSKIIVDALRKLGIDRKVNPAQRLKSVERDNYGMGGAPPAFYT